MTDSRRLTGVDCLPNGYGIAELVDNGGRPEIIGLHTIGADDSWSPAEPAESGETMVAVGVPDDLVIVKHLLLDVSPTDRRERALFELVQSLTGAEQEYVLDIIETHIVGFALGVAVRRDKLQNRVLSRVESWHDLFARPWARMRALALAQGYRRFAVDQPTGVVAVADYDGARISWCLLHEGKPVSLGYLNAARFDQNNPDDCRRLAAELRTSLDFRLAMLFERGLTRPLAALVVTAGTFSEIAVQRLTDTFPVSVNQARVHEGYLAPSVRDQNPATDSFFPALGLAANFLA